MGEHAAPDYSSKEFLKGFAELHRMRSDLVRAMKENDHGLGDILSQIYDDRGHFIYELLQNAEDKLATDVDLTISETGVEIEHNGTLEFTLKDIAAITNIGRSNKKEKFQTIGKFGIGFRSVYRYTSNPKIFLRGFAFEIIDEEIPQKIDINSNFHRSTSTTKFVLPFDEKKEKPEKAALEIKKYVSDLDAPLLFLQNIKRLTIHFKKGSQIEQTFELAKIEKQENLVTLRITRNSDQVKEIPWMILSEPISSELTGGKSSPLHVSLAFRIKSDRERRPENADGSNPSGTQGGLEFAALPGGKLYVYFPAIRENTGLHFYVHAPFESTPSRDAIARDAESTVNSSLIAQSITLLIKNLPKLKNNGLLNKSFLRLLPIPGDPLDSRFRGFQTEIVRALKNTEFILRDDGTYGSPEDSLRIDPRIADSLSEESINFIRALPPKEITQKVATGFVRKIDPRIDALYNSLGMEFFGLEAIREKFLRLNEWLSRVPVENDITKGLKLHLSKMSQSEFGNLITMLGFSGMSKSSYPILPLVLVENNTIRDFVRPSQAFFPSHDFRTGRNFVSPRIGDYFDVGLSHPIFAFYHHVGVREFDSWEELKGQLSIWSKERRTGVIFSPSEVPDAVNELQRVLKICGSQEDRLRMLSTVPILLCENPDGGVMWQVPSKIFMESDNSHGGLSGTLPRLSYQFRRYKLWHGYSAVPNVFGSLSSIGVLNAIPVEKGQHGDWLADWTIPWLEEALKIGDRDFLEKLWDLVTSPEAERNQFHMAVSRTRGGVSTSRSSNLALVLKNYAWVPNRDGVLQLPAELDKSSLHPRFRYRDCLFLKEIKFAGNSDAAKQEEARRIRERDDLDLKAKAFGFASAEEAEKLAKLLKKDPSQIYRLLNAMEAPISTPKVQNPESVFSVARAEWESTPEAEFESVEIKRRSDYIEGQAKRKEYLRILYGDEIGVRCQICEQSSFKKVTNGEDFFYAILTFKEIMKDLHFNGLALCATCNAKYHWGTRQRDLNAFKTALLNASISNEGVVRVQITMVEMAHSVTFAEEHFLALKRQLELESHI